MSRKPPWLRARIAKRSRQRSTRLPQGKLLFGGHSLTDAKQDDAINSHKITRTGWMDMHPRFHDPLHETRLTKAPNANTGAGYLMARSGKTFTEPGFKPWYGNKNEHKPPKVK